MRVLPRCIVASWMITRAYSKAGWQLKPKMCLRSELALLNLGTRDGMEVVVDLVPGYPLAMFLEKIRHELGAADVHLCASGGFFLDSGEPRIFRWARYRQTEIISGCLLSMLLTGLVAQSSTEVSSIINNKFLCDIPGHGKQLFLEVEGEKYEIRLPQMEELRADVEARVAKLESELAPLEKTNSLISRRANAYSRRVLWAGFLYVSAQTAVM